MKKHSLFKKSWLTFMALSLMLLQADLPVWAEAITSEENGTATETTSTQAPNSSTEESMPNSPTESTTSTQEVPQSSTSTAGQGTSDTSASTAPENKKVKTSEPASTASVTFDGIDLTEADNAVRYPNYVASNQAKTLLIEAEFDASSKVSSRKLKIELANGLGYATIPGMVATDDKTKDNWTFKASTLPTHLQGVINNATYIPNEKIGGSLQPKAGTIIYEFSPGTSSARIPIGVRSDLALSVAEDDLTINNGITVTQMEDNTTTLSAVLESYTLTGKVIPSLYAAGNAQTLTVESGQGGSIKKQITESNGGTALRPITAFWVDKLDYTFKADKRAGLQDVKFTSNPEAATVTIDRDSDPDYDIAHIEVGPIALIGEQGLEFIYQTAADTPPGKYEIKYVSAKVTANGQTIDDNSTYARESQYVNVATESAVRLTTVTNNNYAYSSANDNSTTTLGGFALSNQGIDSSAQKLKVVFDDPNIGVRIVSLPYELDGQIKNIVVKTNKGQTFTVASATGRTLVDSMKMSMYDLSLASLGTVADDEYITEVTADIGIIKSGAASYGDYRSASNSITTPYNLGISYHGKLLNVPTSRTFSAKATIVDADKEFDDASAISAINTMNVLDTKYTTFTNYSNLDNNVEWKSGDIQSINANFKLSSYPYLPDATCLAKGFDVYIRAGEFLQVNPETITVTYEGKTYSVANNDIIAVETEDNQGFPVYKIELPDMTTGYTKKDSLDPYSGINVKYDVKVKTSAPTTSFSAADMLFISAKGLTVPDNNGALAPCNNVDQFDVNGNGDTAEKFGTLNNTAVIQLTEQKDFNVATAANLNDGPWVSYDYELNSKIIDLNPSGKAKYQLTVSNNSGSTIEGYTALIPIPKEGEKTDLTPATPDKFNPSEHLQKEAFTWTASLLEPINYTGSLNYQFLYATSYETDKDSPNFKTWDEISDKNEIRMVKVVTNDTIADQFSESITFPLALTDPNADANAGKTNIYSARIYRSILGTAGYKPSEPVAIRLKTGVIKGQVFKDANFNGLMDSDETGVNGVTVLAYETGSNRTKLIESTVTKKIDGKDGRYEFVGLDKKQNVDVVFINPSTDDSYRFSPKTANGSTPTADDDWLAAQTSNVTPSGATFDSINAGLVEPVTITFDAGEGSTAQETVKKYKGESIETEPPAVWEGTTFDGWFTAKTGGSKVTFPYVVGNENITLYAHYTPRSYNVTYDVEGKTNVVETLFNSLLNKPADPEKTGYHFVGWFTAAEGGEQWDFATKKMPPRDLTLYARFEINSYTLTFNDDGKTTTQTVEYNALATEPTAPTKEGYTFDGWYTAATGGEKWDFATNKMPANDLTLYARYEVNNYTVTFDNEGQTTTQEVAYDALVTEPTAPTKEGHTFLGWFTAATGGEKWDFATNKMPANNLTLYARYEVNNYTVTFDNEGQTTTQEVAYDALVTEPTAPTKEGHTFSGWFTAATGGEKWDFATNKMPANNLTLYARYDVESYTVTFDNEGQTTTQDVAFDELITEPTVPSKEGYTFVGWFDADKQWDFAVDKMPARNVTLKARYQVNSYQISYDVQGTITTETANYGSLLTAPSNPVSKKAGYSFVNWQEKESGATWDFATQTVPAHDITLVAQFKADDQTITFDSDGGSPVAALVAPTDSPVDIDAVTQPQKDGYAFVGWFNEQGTQVSGTVAMPAGGMNLKAKWEGVDQVILFDAAGGTGVDSLVAKTGETFTLDDKTTTRPGYTFMGWYDKDGQLATGEQTVPAGGMTYTAKWQADDQEISFDTAGGTKIDPIIVKTDETFTLDDKITTRSGYTFVGWFDKDGQLVTGEQTAPAGGMTYTAKWSADDQTITFDTKGGSTVEDLVAPTDSQVDIDAVAKPTKKGYKFEGWYDSQGTLVSGKITMPAGGMTLSAKWSADPVDPADPADPGKKQAKAKQDPADPADPAKLPATGVFNSPVWLIGLGIIALLCGLVFLKKSKKEA